MSIIDKILKFLRLREHDVEDIVSDFQKKVHKLAAKADSLYLEFSEHEVELALLRQKADDKKAASERASQIAQRINTLING